MIVIAMLNLASLSILCSKSISSLLQTTQASGLGEVLGDDRELVEDTVGLPCRLLFLGKGGGVGDGTLC